jgi:pyruvate formate-lyase activating enzyme-like uncharacterized protein
MRKYIQISFELDDKEDEKLYDYLFKLQCDKKNIIIKQLLYDELINKRFQPNEKIYLSILENLSIALATGNSSNISIPQMQSVKKSSFEPFEKIDENNISIDFKGDKENKKDVLGDIFKSTMIDLK